MVCPAVPSSPFHLAVGVGIAILSFFGIVIPFFWSTFGPYYKKAWTIIFFLLLASEIYSIQVDVTQHDREQEFARCEDRQQFNEIAESLKSSMALNQSQFSSTAAKLKDVINTETGGNAFCYLDFNVSPTWVNGSESKSKFVLALSVRRVGRFPIRDVHFTLMDHAKANRLTAELMNQHPTADSSQMLEDSRAASLYSTANYSVDNLGIASKYLGSYPMESGDTQDFEIFVDAFNSTRRIERTTLRYENGNWFKAILVEGDDSGRPNFTDVDQGFPRLNGRLDVPYWPRPTHGVASWDH